MKMLRLKALAILLLMLAVAAASQWMKPTVRLADHRAKVDLEAMFPRQFGDWHLDANLPATIVSPDLQAQLDKLYNAVLSRTYVDGKGHRVMLSVAYGGDQSDATRAHRPDVCYPAQGFSLLSSRSTRIELSQEFLPVQLLVAKLGPRVEPITFWFTVGDHVAVSAKDQKLAQLRYGLRGIISDGMLVRVSTIDNDSAEAFEVQAGFIKDMYAAFGKDWVSRVFGAAAEKQS
jgi:EpsI family protein